MYEAGTKSVPTSFSFAVLSPFTRFGVVDLIVEDIESGGRYCGRNQFASSV